MGFLKEFKEFAMKGNVLDLAIGVIIGGAFQKIVSSIVNDLLMPVIGTLLGGLSFSQLFVSLNGTSYPTLADAEKAGAAVLKYGSFIQFTIDFLIVALVVFLVIKLINMRRKPVPGAPPPEPTEEILLLRQIRDSLKK